jgi:hypothetical protein
MYIRLPTFVTIPFPDAQAMRGYHAVVDSRYAKMMSVMSVLHNSGRPSTIRTLPDSFLQLLPNPFFMPEHQACDFFITTATPFRGCDCADPALSADIA